MCVFGLIAVGQENWWLLIPFLLSCVVAVVYLFKLVDLSEQRVRPEIQQYTMDPLPPTHDGFGVWRLTLNRRGIDGKLWSVEWGPKVLRNDGRNESSWDLRAWEPEIHGFELENAKRRAQQLMWRLKVNGQTAPQLIREKYPELEKRIPDGY